MAENKSFKRIDLNVLNSSHAELVNSLTKIYEHAVKNNDRLRKQIDELTEENNKLKNKINELKSLSWWQRIFRYKEKF